MYSVGNVMNVKGEPVQCSVFDKEGKHVRRFYFDVETREIWCNNYPTLVKEFGQEDTVRAPIKARTKKEAEAFFCSEEGIKLMAHIIRIMAGELVGLRATKQAERQEVSEAKKVQEVETKPVYKHEIFTSVGSVFSFLREAKDCTDAANWNIAEGESYYRITLVNTLDNETLVGLLVNLGVDYDEVITDVVKTE